MSRSHHQSKARHPQRSPDSKVERVLNHNDMASETTHLTVGGTVLAVAGWLVRHVQVKARKEEPPTVREWHKAQEEIQEALKQARDGFNRLSALLADANLPEMKRLQIIQGAEINEIKASHVGIRAELTNLQRESENQDRRIDHLARRIDDLAE